jgi:colanic acid biosynthesis protein WcaH
MGKKEVISYLPRDIFKSVISNTPLISIDIVAVSDGSFLVGKRLNKPAIDTYFVPGGRIRKNEKFEDALKRISLDEIGIEMNLSSCEFLGIFDHIYDDSAVGDDVNTHYVVLAFSTEIDYNDIDIERIKTQHDDFKMVKISKLQEDRSVHENTKVYARILDLKRRGQWSGF